MNMHPVKSSNIESIGHDPETNTMRVRFQNGGMYDYAGVDAATHAAVMAADSPGSHLHRHIKGCHDCQPCEGAD